MDKRCSCCSYTEEGESGSNFRELVVEYGQKSMPIGLITTGPVLFCVKPDEHQVGVAVNF